MNILLSTFCYQNIINLTLVWQLNHKLFLSFKVVFFLKNVPIIKPISFQRRYSETLLDTNKPKQCVHVLAPFHLHLVHGPFDSL